MAHHLGGGVEGSSRREYGRAEMRIEEPARAEGCSSAASRRARRCG